MDNLLYIYLLSISARVAHEINTVGNVSLWISIVAYIAVMFRHAIFYASDYEPPKVKEEAEKARHHAIEPKVRIGAIIGICFTFLCWTASALCPSTEDVLRAYALVEGSKVINAPNAQHAAEEVGKRFDRFLDIIDKSINPRDADNNQSKK